MLVPEKLDVVLAALRDFVLPVMHDGNQDLKWVPGGGWSSERDSAN